jgi:dehydrogenase/reductase SDR family member 7B
VKNILIIGGTTGLGGQLTDMLLSNGFNVYVLGRSVTGKAKHLPCDLSDENEVKRIITAENLANYEFEWVFLNAGVGMRSPFKDLDLDSVFKIINVNFKSQAAILRTVITPALNKIINISSVQASFAMRNRSLYCATKGSMQLLIESLKLEEPKLNIYNIILGYMRTGLSYNSIGSNGRIHGQYDIKQEKGLLPEVVASKIFRGIMKEPGREILIAGYKERTALFLFRYLRPLFLLLRRVMSFSS